MRQQTWVPAEMVSNYSVWVLVYYQQLSSNFCAVFKCKKCLTEVFSVIFNQLKSSLSLEKRWHRRRRFSRRKSPRRTSWSCQTKCRSSFPHPVEFKMLMNSKRTKTWSENISFVKKFATVGQREKLWLVSQLFFILGCTIDTVNMDFVSCQVQLSLHVLLLFTFCCNNKMHRSILDWPLPKRMFRVSITVRL